MCVPVCYYITLVTHPWKIASEKLKDGQFQVAHHSTSYSPSFEKSAEDTEIKGGLLERGNHLSFKDSGRGTVLSTVKAHSFPSNQR